MILLKINTSEHHECLQSSRPKTVDDLLIFGADSHALLCDILGKGVPLRFKARGSSMSPFIKNGDVLSIYPKLNNTCENGDVVAYRQGMQNKIVIHRIIGVKNGCYMLKGDNTAGNADLVCEKDLLGYVSKVERNGKKAHLGLGPERFLISLLNRLDLLVPLMLTIRRIIRPTQKKLLL